MLLIETPPEMFSGICIFGFRKNLKTCNELINCLDFKNRKYCPDNTLNYVQAGLHLIDGLDGR